MADKKDVKPEETPKIEMEKITFQGVEIEVPKNVAEVIQTKEHEMASGLKTKHEQKMAEVKALQEQIDSNLAKDIDWLNSHPPESWAYYNRRLQGGNGEYTGDSALLEYKSGNSDDETPIKPTAKPMTNDPMLNEINELKKQQAEILNTINRSSVESAVAVMDNLIKKQEYKFADGTAVRQSMRIYHDTYGRPADAETIKSMLKESHTRTKAIIDKTGTFTEKPHSLGMPPPGAAPRTPPKNVPTSFESPDLVKLVSEYLSGEK